MSNDVDLQYILPDISLGLEERQGLFESRLRNLVLTFIYRPRKITKSLLAGRSCDFKWASCSARSHSFHHLPDRTGERGGVVSQVDVSSFSYDCWIIIPMSCVKLPT